MVREWYNTNVSEAAGMIDVTDKWILENSCGEVYQKYEDMSDGNDDNVDGNDDDNGDGNGDDDVVTVVHTLEDPEIFGRLDDPDQPLRLGHIALPGPIVNMQYFKGRNPILSRITGLSMLDLEKVIYYACYLVIIGDGTTYHAGDILSERDYLDIPDNVKSNLVIKIGAEAIEAYIREHCDTKMLDKIILHNIPVLPLCVRYVEDECEEQGRHWVPRSLNKSYERVLWRKVRLDRLISLGAPAVIIRNEWRMLQESVDSLIINSARGRLLVGWSYIPYLSLDEVHEAIIDPNPQKFKEMPENVDELLDIKTIRDKAVAAIKYSQENIEDGVAYPLDDPVILELNKMDQEIVDLIKPFATAYLRENYMSYQNRFDTIFGYCTQELASTIKQNIINGYDLKDDDYFDDDDLKYLCTHGVGRYMDSFIKYQLKWCLL